MRIKKFELSDIVFIFEESFIQVLFSLEWLDSDKLYIWCYLFAARPMWQLIYEICLFRLKDLFSIVCWLCLHVCLTEGWILAEGKKKSQFQIVVFLLITCIEILVLFVDSVAFPNWWIKLWQKLLCVRLRFWKLSLYASFDSFLVLILKQQLAGKEYSDLIFRFSKLQVMHFDKICTLCSFGPLFAEKNCVSHPWQMTIDMIKKSSMNNPQWNGCLLLSRWSAILHVSCPFCKWTAGIEYILCDLVKLTFFVENDWQWHSKCIETMCALSSHTWSNITRV